MITYLVYLFVEKVWILEWNTVNTVDTVKNINMIDK